MNQQTELDINDLDQARLYVWDDPILDRAAFEDRLQNEPHLADLVAEAVSESIEVKAAFLSTSQAKNRALVVPTSEPHRVSRFLVNTAWALSIAVAIAVLAIPTQWKFESESDAPLSALAQIWSELYDQSSSHNTSELVDSTIEPIDENSDIVLSIADEPDRELPDWLLAATTYQTTDAGVTP